MCILDTNEFVNQRYPQVAPLHRTQHRHRSHPYYTAEQNTLFYAPAYSATTASGRVSRRNYNTHVNALSTQFWPLNIPDVQATLPRPQLVRQNHQHTAMNENAAIERLNEQTTQLQATLRNTLNTLSQTAAALRTDTIQRTNTMTQLNTRITRTVSTDVSSNESDSDVGMINRTVNNTAERLPALQAMDVNVSPEPASSIPQHSRSNSVDDSDRLREHQYSSATPSQVAESDSEERQQTTPANVEQPKVRNTERGESTAETVSSEA